MADFLDIPSAYDAIRELERTEWDALPPKVQEVLNQTAQVGSSPVDRVVRTAEAIFANRPAASATAQETAAGLFALASMNGWHGVNEDDRAAKAMAVLRGGSDKNAPEPRAEFVPQPEPPEPPAE